MTDSDFSATNVNRIRLVTVNQFPTQAAQTTASSADRFAARCAVFENHYLQHTKWACASSADSFTSIGGIAKRFPSSFRTGFFVPPDTTAMTENNDWAKMVTSQETSKWPSAAAIVNCVAELREFQSVWLHFELPNCNREAAFESILQALGQLHKTDQAVTILTAVEGSTSQLPAPFTSLAPEGMIRVPLWIEIPNQDGCSVQTITGTSDIAFTIEQNLARGTITADEMEDASVLNLIKLASRPGKPVSRMLFIQQRKIRAVRTDDFLFVESTGTDISDEQMCALYAKPEDVWNIRDVSAEYETVAAELSEYLHQSRMQISSDD